jgi:hypothetical protein
MVAPINIGRELGIGDKDVGVPFSSPGAERRDSGDRIVSLQREKRRAACLEAGNSGGRRSSDEATVLVADQAWLMFGIGRAALCRGGCRCLAAA